MRRILSILLENEPNALSRVVGLFSQRGYNIESLTVAPTNDATLSCVTIQTIGDEKILEQIKKQLHKLIDVFRVRELGQNSNNYVEREIMLIKLHINNFKLNEIKHNTDIFRGQIIDVSLDTYIIQLSGASSKLDAFLVIIQKLVEIVEVARSGIVSLSRGTNLYN